MGILGFVKLTEALRLWTRRNPIERGSSGKLLNARIEDFKVKDCVYCDGKTHKSPECTKVVKPAETREILKKSDSVTTALVQHIELANVKVDPSVSIAIDVTIPLSATRKRQMVKRKGKLC